MTNDDQYDVYADENEPTVKEAYKVYVVYPPFQTFRRRPYTIYVSCYDSDGLANLEQGTHWFGKSLLRMNHAERKVVLDFLCELELLELRRIGPEDSEYFATSKLTQTGASGL